MSEKKRAAQPFHQLGEALKQIREKRRESLAEVSGAVEIEIDQLTEFEKGSLRPSEDVLLLLISHFAMKEDRATQLWELAGFDRDDVPTIHMMNDDSGQSKPVVAVMPIEAHVIYTDKVHVMVNNYGVVMNFMQSSGSNQPLTVARLGMSKEHAASVLDVLKSTLARAEKPKTRSLPSPRSESEKPSKE